MVFISPYCHSYLMLCDLLVPSYLPLNFLKTYLYFSMYVQIPVSTPGAGVAGSFQSFNMSAGNLCLLGRLASAFSDQVISPDHFLLIYPRGALCPLNT